MPSFEYFCKNCKTIFEELILDPAEVKKYSQSHPCLKCRKPATRVPSAVNFAFKAPAGRTQGSGVHGQSGVHDLDYPSLDKAIGRSSDKKWGVYNERKKARDKVRKATGKNAVAQVGDKVTPLSVSDLNVRSKAMALLSKAKKNAKDSR